MADPRICHFFARGSVSGDAGGGFCHPLRPRPFPGPGPPRLGPGRAGGCVPGPARPRAERGRAPAFPAPAGPPEGARAGARPVGARALVEGLPGKPRLNIKVPAGPLAGIRVTRLGHRVYQEKVVRETAPRGLPYYWIGAGPPVWSEDEASDIAAVHRGLASVTPLHMDLTHHGALQRMAEWDGALTALLKKRPR